MKTLQKGFTLIELMIVVAIIAILAAIAIPAYQDYTIRAQVSEGASLASGAKTAIAEYRADRGTWPTSNANAGLESSANIKGKYVSSVDASNGKITVTYGNSANSKISGKNMIYSAVSNAGSIDWVCKGGDVDTKYRPTVCRTTT
ncbi:pilin [Luteimonas terrae]|uniref:Prepilin-type N-terminal cleavage/methylation domain-containing protein n=1 Tax=Luteimonas terrae TaxID=1530191 RepID=A0A4R5U6Y5_9GAMM|nr:pilin [Luteimonas terrae]TDK30056.1 prepilin-type N-terminal cleavage/methylation domain-containing protein [Luteimonas terrae]